MCERVNGRRERERSEEEGNGDFRYGEESYGGKWVIMEGFGTIASRNV